MTTRRSFITGLVAFVAAPAIVRADILKHRQYTVYLSEDLECLHFDFTNGRGYTNFACCKLTRCTFASDATTKQVQLSGCLLIEVDMAWLSAIPEDQIKAEYNTLFRDLPDRNSISCEVPTS